MCHGWLCMHKWHLVHNASPSYKLVSEISFPGNKGNKDLSTPAMRGQAWASNAPGEEPCPVRCVQWCIFKIGACTDTQVARMVRESKTRPIENISRKWGILPGKEKDMRAHAYLKFCPRKEKADLFCNCSRQKSKDCWWKAAKRQVSIQHNLTTRAL